MNGEETQGRQISQTYVKCSIELYNAVTDAILLLRLNQPEKAAQVLEKAQKEMQSTLAQTSAGLKINIFEEMENSR